MKTKVREGRSEKNQRERKREKGQWAVYYTNPQCFITTFSCLANFGDFSEF